MIRLKKVSYSQVLLQISRPSTNLNATEGDALCTYTLYIKQHIYIYMLLLS